MWRAEDRRPELEGVIDAARRLAPPQRDLRPLRSTPDASDAGSAGTAAADPQISAARVLVHHISLWPFVRVELRGDDAAVHSAVRDTVIATLNLATGALTVFVITDMVRALVETEPLVRVTRDGVRLDVSDAGSRKAGERLIRWRVDLERFGPQLWEASP